jgi:hypothetical protein
MRSGEPPGTAAVGGGWGTVNVQLEFADPPNPSLTTTATV